MPKNHAHRVELLKARLTDEFLATLADAARTCGWEVVEYPDVVDFVNWCREIAGRPLVTWEAMTPYVDDPAAEGD